MTSPIKSIATVTVFGVLAATAVRALPTVSAGALNPQVQAKLSVRSSIAPLTPQQRGHIAGTLMKTESTPAVGAATSLTIDRFAADGRYLTFQWPYLIGHVGAGPSLAALNNDSETQVTIEGGAPKKSYLADCQVSDDLDVSWSVDGPGGVAISGTTTSAGKHLSFLVQTTSAQPAVLHIRSLHREKLFGLFALYGCDVMPIG
ncbi:hypothetical protein [Asticcacaulis benevestitus]|uniref:Ig-like domain-containing protein n=1 Tax=Asticcacaulis benevestitus DSM 16100 = ATCC BAA-896 TaxID=1121022 RepID=V4RGK4_9CAUL|nr:hypothetical protein [Asticcacaulis benevestitus]ESQ90483.1 hypothetical protein ABENE_12230 [Asticcacaulis benevestitus DSM 16100 = ATCC BAA-896]